MTLYETISNHLKEAMKAGDTLTRDTIRLIQSALKNVALEKRKEVSVMTDEEVIEVLKRLVKQRRDSITQYQAGGRNDLVANEEAEIEVIAKYLPSEMDDTTLKKTVTSALEGAGLSQKSDMGKAMGIAMGSVKGQASGDRVKKVVESILQ